MVDFKRDLLNNFKVVWSDVLQEVPLQIEKSDQSWSFYEGLYRIWQETLDSFIKQSVLSEEHLEEIEEDDMFKVNLDFFKYIEVL